MSRWKPLGYLILFLVPTLPLRATTIANAAGWPDLAGWYPLLVLFVFTPILDHLVGRDTRNPADEAEADRLDALWYYRLPTLASVPAYGLLLAWSAHAFATLPLSPLGRAAWLASQGVIGGVVAINVAHELIHRRGRFERTCGGLLLAMVSYAGFKVEHVRGHHVHVATPLDTSTAPRGMSVYAFVARALAANPVRAFRLEAQRLVRKGYGALSWRNEVVGGYALSALFALALGAWLGAEGVLFFVAQSVLAAATLEVVNYVEHYGLARRRTPGGGYERVGVQHSWNSSFLVTNLLLLQLQRHSDHHARPWRRYPSLRHVPDAPQLPSGYAGMFVLALLPPLWFRVMHPRLDAWAARQAIAA